MGALIPFTISNNLLQQTCGLNYFNMSETNEVRPESSEEIKEEKQEITEKEMEVTQEKPKDKRSNIITTEEMAAHNDTKSGVWISIHGRVLDIQLTPESSCGIILSESYLRMKLKSCKKRIPPTGCSMQTKINLAHGHLGWFPCHWLS